MKSILSAAMICLAIAFWSHSAAAFTFSGTNCNILDSVAGLVNKTHLPICRGLVLPGGVGVSTFGTDNDLVEIRLDVYECQFRFRSALGPNVNDHTLIAQAGLGLNNSLYFDLGSSTASVRLAASVQSNSAFNLFYGPGIQLHQGANTSFASRFNFLPRGADFFINATELETVALPAAFNTTFVEYFNTVIRGAQSVTYSIETTTTGTTRGTTECNNQINGVGFTSDCFDLRGYDQRFTITEQDTAPLYVAQC